MKTWSVPLLALIATLLGCLIQTCMGSLCYYYANVRKPGSMKSVRERVAKITLCQAFYHIGAKEVRRDVTKGSEWEENCVKYQCVEGERCRGQPNKMFSLGCPNGIDQYGFENCESKGNCFTSSADGRTYECRIENGFHNAVSVDTCETDDWK